MKTITYTAARNNFASIMDKVCEDHAPYVVTRNNSEPVVIMSLQDFESYEETAYLLSNPVNAARLAEGIAEAEAFFAEQRVAKKQGKSVKKTSTGVIEYTELLKELEAETAKKTKTQAKRA